LTHQLPLAKIRLDGGTQPRAETDSVAIEEYANAMLAGDEFPPVIVYFDGQDYWLASGFHRYAAAAAAGFEEIDCDVIQGTRRDAVLFSVGVNAEHGLRRTRDDKRRAVRKLLEDEEWREWSDSVIGRAAKVEQPLVSELRGEMYPKDENRIRFAQRGDTVYPIDTANLRGRPSNPKEEILPPRTVAPGHREAEERTRFIAFSEAIRAIKSAQGTLPADPRVVAAGNPDVTVDEAYRISAWWAKLSAELRGRVERAS
jgi:hypothetical protein